MRCRAGQACEPSQMGLLLLPGGSSSGIAPYADDIGSMMAGNVEIPVLTDTTRLF